MPRWASFYPQMFWNRVRRPFSLFAQSFLSLGVALAQLARNALGTIMALAILWPELGNSEGMTLTLLTVLTLTKSILGFSGFLSSRHRVLFNPPTSNKHWKDHKFYVGDDGWSAMGLSANTCPVALGKTVSVLPFHRSSYLHFCGSEVLVHFFSQSYPTGCHFLHRT